MRYLTLMLILAIGITPYASAAQLDASILFDDEVTEPSFEFFEGHLHRIS